MMYLNFIFCKHKFSFQNLVALNLRSNFCICEVSYLIGVMVREKRRSQICYIFMEILSTLRHVKQGVRLLVKLNLLCQKENGLELVILIHNGDAWQTWLINLTLHANKPRDSMLCVWPAVQHCESCSIAVGCMLILFIFKCNILL